MRNRSCYTRGVAVLAGIALLVGVLGTAVPTIAASPGEAVGNVGKAVCWVVTLGVCIYFLPIGEPFGTRQEPEPMRCTPARFTGPPTFLTKPIMTAKYLFHGSCSRADLPNAPALNYRLEGSWTPSETNPNKPNASESLEITGYEPYLPDRAPGGRIFMYWTARCNREPWLSPEGGDCQNLRAYIPEDMRSSVTDLEPATFPKSRNAIPANDRQQFYAKYLQLTSPATARANSLTKAPVPSGDMFTIIRPANNDRVQQGQVVVRATPPKVGMTQVTQLEFRWLDAPPNQPYVNNFAVDTSSLLAGYSVPQQITRGNAGRWEVRARASGKAVPGPWSFPVHFQLFLTQPTQSQKQASPVPLTSPLPSSTIVQPSPVPQPAPAPSSSVMQAPPSSSSTTTQMRRSPSMVMPRGVDEKGGKESSETEVAPVEGIQKP